MSTDWRSHIPQLEGLARKLGLDWSQVIFEAVPDSFMTEIAVYGLPVRMPHWSFGARYIYQLLQRHMGYSRWSSPAIPGTPTSPPATDSRITSWSPRTCSVTPIFPRTTCCSAAARI